MRVARTVREHDLVQPIRNQQVVGCNPTARWSYYHKDQAKLLMNPGTCGSAAGGPSMLALAPQRESLKKDIIE